MDQYQIQDGKTDAASALLRQFQWARQPYCTIQTARHERKMMDGKGLVGLYCFITIACKLA